MGMDGREGTNGHRRAGRHEWAQKGGKTRMGTEGRDTSYPAYEDGTDRVFRNVGIQQSDAGEIPKRIHTVFLTLFLSTTCFGSSYEPSSG